MDFNLWLAFIISSFILCVSPGPTVFVIIGQSIFHGKRSTLPLILGILIGDVVLIGLSSLGLGAVAQSSPALFIFIKYLASLYP